MYARRVDTEQTYAKKAAPEPTQGLKKRKSVKEVFLVDEAL